MKVAVKAMPEAQDARLAELAPSAESFEAL